MNFNGYLTSKQKLALTEAAIASGLLKAPPDLLTAHINSTFLAHLPDVGTPLDRFELALDFFNKRERLLDGSVPLPIFLDNCATWLRLRALPGADVFASIATIVDNLASGAYIPPPATGAPTADVPEVIIGIDEMLDFAFLARGAQAGKSVGLIRVPRFDATQQVKGSEDRPVLFSGTAWLIADRLALTNHHVINARRADEAAASAADFALQARSAIINFGYDYPGAPDITVAVEDVIAHDAALDYALLRLRNGGIRPLDVNARQLEHSPAHWIPVNIIQHPRGGYKRAGIRSNLVTSTTAAEVRYLTDTDVGSSGSPVFDDNWRVVALHRGARPVAGVQFQGKTTAFINFGSQISAIVNDIGNKAPALLAEITQAQHQE